MDKPLAIGSEFLWPGCFTTGAAPHYPKTNIGPDRLGQTFINPFQPMVELPRRKPWEVHMGARDISFASFNLLNLQLPGRAIYGDRDGWDTATYHKKVDYMARALNRLDAM